MPSSAGAESTTPSPDVDLVDGALFGDGFPHAVFETLRRESPVFRHPGASTADDEDFWVVTRYRDVVEAAENPALSSEGGGGRTGGGTHLDDLQRGMHVGILLNMLDDPRHALFREIVSPTVARDAVLSRVPFLREEAHRLVDSVLAAGGAGDVVWDVAAPYAVHSVATVLGAPRDDWPRLLAWANAVLGNTEREGDDARESAAAITMAIVEYGMSLLAAKRAQPGDDMLSALVTGDIPPESGEQPLSEIERLAFVPLLLLAGSEKPRNTMAAGVLALARHPEQWQALRSDRSLVAGAVEEILRWCSPIPFHRRTATTDLLLGGTTTIRAGEKVTLWWPSANRDEAVFPEPDAFDVRRGDNPHLAFGRGTHDCMGSALARLELTTLLTVLLDRVATIEVTGPVTWSPSNRHTVPLTVPVELVPA